MLGVADIRFDTKHNMHRNKSLMNINGAILDIDPPWIQY